MGVMYGLPENDIRSSLVPSGPTHCWRIGKTYCTYTSTSSVDLPAYGHLWTPSTSRVGHKRPGPANSGRLRCSSARERGWECSRAHLLRRMNDHIPEQPCTLARNWSIGCSSRGRALGAILPRNFFPRSRLTRGSIYTTERVNLVPAQ